MLLKVIVLIPLLILFVDTSSAYGKAADSTSIPDVNKPSPDQSKIQTTNTALEHEKSPTCCDEYFNKVADERKHIEEQADKQYVRFWDFVSFAGKVIFGIALVVLAFLGWFLPKSWRDLKDRAETVVDKLFREEGMEIINREAGNIKEVVAGLKNEIENLVRFKKGRIVWVFEHDRITADDEIKALYAQGFERIDIFTPPDGSPIEIGEADLVILSYDKTPEAKRRMGLVVDSLVSSTPPIHLIIYTFNQGSPVRISDQDENDILARYKWHIMANFPSTLVGHVSLLVRQTRIPIERGGLNG